MKNYDDQKPYGIVLFKASTIKQCLTDARTLYGEEVEIITVHKNGSLFEMEVRPKEAKLAFAKPEVDASPFPVLMDPEKENSKAPFPLLNEHFKIPEEVKAEKKETSPVFQGDSKQGVSLHLEKVDELEKRFEKLLNRMESIDGHQAEGLKELHQIKSSLLMLGFAEPFVSKLTGAMMDCGAVNYNKNLALKILSEWLKSVGQASELKEGFHAIVGPAGSGKTTTIAKLASRAVSLYGSEGVGLITTDFYRLGAYEQLKAFGELLKVKVYPARSAEELTQLRQALQGKKVVYVDTVGTSRDDDKMLNQMALLKPLGIMPTMAVQACLSRSVMKADVDQWKRAGAESVIITKLDQALEIAALVETLITMKMPFHFATTGQNVPADLHKVSPLLLADRALRDYSNVSGKN